MEEFRLNDGTIIKEGITIYTINKKGILNIIDVDEDIYNITRAGDYVFTETMLGSIKSLLIYLKQNNIPIVDNTLKEFDKIYSELQEYKSEKSLPFDNEPLKISIEEFNNKCKEYFIDINESLKECDLKDISGVINDNFLDLLITTD